MGIHQSRSSARFFPPSPHTFLLLGDPSPISNTTSTPRTLRCLPLEQTSLSSRSLCPTACCPLRWLLSTLPSTCPNLNSCHEPHKWYFSSVLFLSKLPMPEVWQSFLVTTILPPKSTHRLLSTSITIRPSRHLLSPGAEQCPSFLSFSFKATSF